MMGFSGVIVIIAIGILLSLLLLPSLLQNWIRKEAKPLTDLFALLLVDGVCVCVCVCGIV